MLLTAARNKKTYYTNVYSHENNRTGKAERHLATTGTRRGTCAPRAGPKPRTPIAEVFFYLYLGRFFLPLSGRLGMLRASRTTACYVRAPVCQGSPCPRAPPQATTSRKRPRACEPHPAPDVITRAGRQEHFEAPPRRRRRLEAAARAEAATGTRSKFLAGVADAPAAAAAIARLCVNVRRRPPCSCSDGPTRQPTRHPSFNSRAELQCSRIVLSTFQLRSSQIP
jgi:hypothetical protein